MDTADLLAGYYRSRMRVSTSLVLTLLASCLGPTSASTASKESPQNTSSAICLQRGRRPIWVVWMGDSNTRHTYYWWVTSKLKADLGATVVAQSREFGIDRSDLSYGGRWSDQEAVLTTPDGLEIRASFRFLTSSHAKVHKIFTNWHDAQLAHHNNDDKFNASEFHARKPGEASAYAQWATKNSILIKHPENVAKLLSKYAHRHPDGVIMNEGWAQTPTCRQVKQITKWMGNNLGMAFVWSPLYVTNRQADRRKCFTKVFNAIKVTPNVDLLRMWDEKFYLGDSDENIHTPVGGTYMQSAVDLFFRHLCAVQRSRRK